MCIAILKTKDGNITDEQLLNCFDNNPDGAGLAYTKDNKIIVVKGIFEATQFVEEYHKAVAEADGAMLVHCRIGTSGFKDYTNCSKQLCQIQGWPLKMCNIKLYNL